MPFYAHTKCNSDGTPCPQDSWEPLFSEECATLRGGECKKCQSLDPDHGHLNKVAYLTGKFAAEMFPEDSQERDSARQWGYLAGLWHDLGKFAPEWQDYLKTKSDPHADEVSEKVDHATAGAQMAVGKSELGHIIANAIAGHHSGLLDANSSGACLKKRLTKEIFPASEVPSFVKERAVPQTPGFLATQPNDFPVSFFQRMLFSCLVDADFLATEAFMNPDQWKQRPQHSTSVFSEALALLETRIDKFGRPKTKVDHARSKVLADCMRQAGHPPGLFTLTVPTGGGKTFSSLAFALKHAIQYKQRRIIYVIPFTSIIEQNAQVFSDVLADLGPDIVLEHHSNLSPEKAERESERSRLATENWDAPIIVTTAVQFYESLFAAKTSRSRKLHNIANSVVIFDEAQTLPVEYLTPCLRAVEQLTKNYHTTAVLCTATQPAIERKSHFPIGLNQLTEIVSDIGTLFDKLDRVHVQYRGALDDTTLCNEINDAEQVLCIVNTRKHAQSLYQNLSPDGANLHLSALMCPKHRMQVLQSARERVAKKKPIRLISTQLIEAGVDIDFPLVYRSMAGLDSIAQAAGRCNRNGRSEKGKVHVFHSEHIASERFFQATASVGHEMLDLHADAPLSTDSIRAYFDKYYSHQKDNWDAKKIMDDFKCGSDPSLPLLFQYRSVAEKFKLIENTQVPVIIPWDGDAVALVKELRNESIPLNRNHLRRLQAYTVQIQERQFLENRVQFESIRDGQLHILICPKTHYSDQFGLNFANEKSLIC
jgi:CRISPR-associated endonuclease/helicase Cas3